MFQKNSVLVDLATGEKVYCLAVRKTGSVVVAYDSAYQLAKSQLIDDATNNPDNVRGGIIKYLAKSQRLDVDPSRLITQASYDAAMNSPECKAVREKIEKLKTELDSLTAEVKAKNNEIRMAYRETVNIMMNPSKVVDSDPKPKPKLIKK